jgi:hypothetical protein
MEGGRCRRDVLEVAEDPVGLEPLEDLAIQFALPNVLSLLFRCIPFERRVLVELLQRCSFAGLN